MILLLQSDRDNDFCCWNHCCWLKTDITVIIIMSSRDTYPKLLGKYSVYLLLIKYKTQGSQLATVAKLLAG